MDAPVSLGFDLGGTQVRAALVRGGQVIKRAAQRTDVGGGPEAVLEQFRQLADEVVIASGGAGSLEDFKAAKQKGASAVAAGAMFVFQGPHRAVLITYPPRDQLEAALG